MLLIFFWRVGWVPLWDKMKKRLQRSTSFCPGTLYLNTGVPDEAKINACILAGKKANELKHPVVLDPVGIGASTFRQKAIKNLLAQVHPDLIRCNQEEAAVLCALFLTVLLRLPWWS